MLVASLAGCTADIGPVVRDVRFGSDGRMAVQRCNLHNVTSVFSSELTLTDCRTVFQEIPGGATAGERALGDRGTSSAPEEADARRP